MEQIIRLHIEQLPEGVFLATSDDVQELSRKEILDETLEIARDVAQKILEAKKNGSNFFKIL